MADDSEFRVGVKGYYGCVIVPPSARVILSFSCRWPLSALVFVSLNVRFGGNVIDSDRVRSFGHDHVELSEYSLI